MVLPEALQGLAAGIQEARSMAGATGLGMQVAPGQAGLGLQAQWSVTQFNITQLRLAQGWLPSGWHEEASAVSGPHA